MKPKKSNDMYCISLIIAIIFCGVAVTRFVMHDRKYKKEKKEEKDNNKVDIAQAIIEDYELAAYHYN